MRFGRYSPGPDGPNIVRADLQTGDRYAKVAPPEGGRTMHVEPTEIPEVLHIVPKRFGDARGYFVETFHAARYAAAGIALPFVQDNLSRSGRGVLRGLHLQNPSQQGKLVNVLEGEVFDVAVDVRVGKHVGVVLSAERSNQLWVPPGFAHGFQVISETALFAYKCTDLYAPAHELGVLFSDEALGIAWPVASPILSDRDRAHSVLAEIDVARLPKYESASR
jgi:dTDP-4-dehydrorhamnose 3,5-epimerase